MAFDFLGTFNKSQLDRFFAFARSQLPDINDRIAHLYTEKRRVGTLTVTYDADGVPTSYAVDKPPESYIAKLVAAYEVLGGDVLFDLNIRSQSQAVHFIRADESVPAQRLSSGEVIGQPGLMDADSAERMREARTWLSDVTRYKRENLERKIRRALDYVDQLEGEIALLSVIKMGAEASKSLEWVYTKLTDLINDRSYRAIYDDKGADAHGRKTMAPFAAYPAGPGRPDAVSDQRTFDGFESATETTE